MIQDGNGQGSVFNPEQGFGERSRHDDFRSLFLEPLLDFECNERLVLSDEDQASCERSFHCMSPCFRSRRALHPMPCQARKVPTIWAAYRASARTGPLRRHFSATTACRETPLVAATIPRRRRVSCGKTPGLALLGGGPYNGRTDARGWSRMSVLISSHHFSESGSK